MTGRELADMLLQYPDDEVVIGCEVVGFNHEVTIVHIPMTDKWLMLAGKSIDEDYEDE